MELTETFSVPFSADVVWPAIVDVERLAPCVPGFELQRAADPVYSGALKVKLGAIKVQYDATITFVERDDAAKRAVLSVEGRERQRPGTMSAKVTVSLDDHGAETTAQMFSEVQLTGRVAQFGGGMIADVSALLTQQFVTNLNELLAAGARPASANGTAQASVDGTAQASPASVRPGNDDVALNLGAVVAVPLLKRVAPVALAGVLIAVLVRLRRR